MAPLTEKQNQFCLEVVRGASLTEAYRRAGYKAQGKAAESGSSRLVRSAKVVARIDELRAQLDSQKIMDAKERRERLTEIARSEKAEARDAIKAIDVLNKMDAAYVTRTELTGALEVTHPTIEVTFVDVVAAPEKEEADNGAG